MSKRDPYVHNCCICASEGVERWGTYGFAGRLFGKTGKDAKRTYWFCDEHRAKAEANKNV